MITILLVEPYDDLRNMFADYFSITSTYRIIHTTNGVDARNACAEFVPDVVVTESRLPGTDGLTLCRQIREDRRLSRIHLIILTASCDEVDATDTSGLGVARVLYKPCLPEVLADVIVSQWERSDPRLPPLTH
jgi:two-component system, OmpR family, response regulator BaeR